MADISILAEVLEQLGRIGHGTRMLFTPRAKRKTLDFPRIIDFLIGAAFLIALITLIMLAVLFLQ